MFFDSWLDEGSIDRLVPNNSILRRWGADIKIADWWVEGQWNIPSSFRRRCPNIANSIKSYQLKDVDDTLVWKSSRCSSFTIASCYKIIRYKRERVVWRNV